jgi:hypothetical protein
VISLTAIERELAAGELKLSGRFVMELRMPAQDESLLDTLEQETVVSGQEFMRQLFRLMVGEAD